ncbi:MAG: hypothetical protein AB8B62_06005 [Roseobacter sp.]
MRLWTWITYPFVRAPRRPLAQRQPKSVRATGESVPLGLEAIDMSVVDSTNRRNASLERVSTFFSAKGHLGSFTKNADSHVTPLADDETYAARYHRAYNQKKGH